jgi:hypothetical protein
MNTDRRWALAALGTLLAPVASAAETAKSAGGFMSKDGKSIHGRRIFTDKDGNTHVGDLELKGTLAEGGSGSIVPAGCTSFFEGPAVAVLVRAFPPKFDTDYHNDPAHQHQLVFTMQGVAAGGCKDGTSFRLAPGDFMSVEDPTGQGHKAFDAGGEGFTQLFVSMPSGD